jgi:hypothetical protein
MSLVFGERTDVARWDALTSQIGGSYRWYGIAWGWMFFGFMIRVRPDARKDGTS